MTDAPTRARIQALAHITGSTALANDIIAPSWDSHEHAQEAVAAVAALQRLVDLAAEHPSDKELVVLQPFTEGSLTVADLCAIMQMPVVTQLVDPALMRRVCPDWNESMHRRLVQLRDTLYDHIS